MAAAKADKAGVPAKRRSPAKIPGPGVVVAGGALGTVLAGGISMIPSRAWAGGLALGLGILASIGAAITPKRHKEARIVLAAAGVTTAAAGILQLAAWGIEKWGGDKPKKEKEKKAPKAAEEPEGGKPVSLRDRREAFRMDALRRRAGGGMLDEAGEDIDDEGGEVVDLCPMGEGTYGG